MGGRHFFGDRDLVGVTAEDVAASIGMEQVLSGAVGVKFSDAASGALAAGGGGGWRVPRLQRARRRVLLCLV